MRINREKKEIKRGGIKKELNWNFEKKKEKKRSFIVHMNNESTK